MGVWVYLEQDGVSVSVPAHQEGGVYALGGTQQAEISITYNYSRLFDAAVPGYSGLVEWFDGRRAGDVLPELEQAARVLGTERDPDYWKPTPGNAGHIAAVLADWARAYPDAVFSASG